MMRMSTGLTVAAAILLSASGCSLVTDAGTVGGIVYDDAASELIVQRLQATLEELPGVDESSVDFDAFGETGREASAEIDASSADARQLVSIAESVRAAFDNPDLGVIEPIATISTGDESILTMAAFAMSSDDLAADLTYWSNIRDILGTTLFMELRASTDGYYRFIAQPGEAELTASMLRARWPAVIALDDPSTAAKSWSLPPRLQVSGSLPDQPVLDLLAELATVGPRFDSGPSSALGVIGVGTDQPAITLTMMIESATGDVAASPNWPRIAAASRAAVASTIPLRTVSYIADVDGASTSQGFVFIGLCATTPVVADGDTEFFDALAAAGIALPDGSGPGSCR